MKPAFRQTMMALPGVGVSMLPKLMCPACWPAYAGIVSALGLGFLISPGYLLPLTVGFLAITAAALGYRASRRHGYGPFLLALIAAAVILVGNFISMRHRRPMPGSVCSLQHQYGTAGHAVRLHPHYMKHKIEIFSAGCTFCNDAIETVKKLAGSEHEIVVHDMHRQEIAHRAAQRGVRSLPAVVVDGKLAACCAGRGIDENALREALQ